MTKGQGHYPNFHILDLFLTYYDSRSLKYSIVSAVDGFCRCVYNVASKQAHIWPNATIISASNLEIYS